MIADCNGFNKLTMASLSCQNVSLRRVSRTSDKLLLFFSLFGNSNVAQHYFVSFLALSKLVTIEACLVFFGNLSVQFTFSAYCIAFNMSTSMCL